MAQVRAYPYVGCGIALIGLVLTTDPNAPQSPAALVPVGTSSFAISLSLNFIVSALIVGRIWFLSRNEIIERDRGIKRAAAIVIESGLLFLWAQFVFTVLFAISHPAQAIIEPVATQIYVSVLLLHLNHLLTSCILSATGNLTDIDYSTSWDGLFL